MNKQTQAIHTAFQRRDSYSALNMPVYHTAAYEFDNAADVATPRCLLQEALQRLYRAVQHI